MKAIDYDYLDAIYNSVPRGGFAFTFSHFNPILWFKDYFPPKKFATINYSADIWKDVLYFFKKCSIPTVLTVAQNFWGGSKSIERDGVRVVRCPEEYNPAVSCVNCGGEKGPLCARSERNYIIGFTAHGGSKNKINRGERGGCYANGGNVNIHWERLSQKQQDKTDAEILREFVKTIPPRRILRHHIAGDIGKQ
tara:strand:+ start:61 stop:642 length:582 start_codon:yes stop_codon:yes gene_type:complete